MKPIPNFLLIKRNKRVLDWLTNKNCHSDIVGPLSLALHKKEGVNIFCPDGQNFSYCLWHLGETVFAFGEGMQRIGLRLPSGGEFAPFEFDKSWFQIPWNHPDMADLAESAYLFAKSP